MTAGFIALPREAIRVFSTNAWFPGDLFTASLYAFLVAEARFVDDIAPCPRQNVILKTGQLLFGERKVADAFGVSRKRIRTGILRLHHGNKIGLVSGPLGTIITINDYYKLYLHKKEYGPSNGPTGGPLEAHCGPHNDKETRRQGDKHDHAESSAGANDPTRGDSVLETPGQSGSIEREQDVRPNANPTDQVDMTHPSSAQPLPPTPRAMAAIWNEECRGGMAKALKLNPGTLRWRTAQARLKENSDLEYWRGLVRRIAANPVYRGEAPMYNGSIWAADFDWFVRSGTESKILEGRCDERKTPSRPPPLKLM